MKKKLTIVTILVLILLLVLTACGAREKAPLRICVDMAYANYEDENITREKILYDIEYELKNFDGLENFVFEYIPGSGAERETALDRIRTELMSGGGPDVFIVNCVGATYSVVQEDALFLMPEKAMEIGLFLPLDDLMENNTQHAEWDKMTQSVLAAGKNEDGQLLIPMTYTVPVTMYLKEELQHTPSKEMTWQDMLADDSLRDAATLLGDGMIHVREEGGTWYWGFDAPMHYMLGDLADFENEKLLFTEEELQACMDRVFALQADIQATDFSLYTREKWYEGYLGVGMNCCIWNQWNTHGMEDKDTFSLVPFYSDDGGATAVVLNYMAINANTRRPEDAFKVIDRLMSRNMQQNKAFYIEDLYMSLGAMPMYEELMRKDDPIERHSDTHIGTFYSDENYETVCALRDSIARARFAGELDMMLFNLMLECDAAVRSGEDYTQIVSNTYTAMKQIVAE